MNAADVPVNHPGGTTMTAADVHTARVVALLFLTLLAMRLVSWALARVTRRVSSLGPRPGVVTANVVALGAFVAWLYLDLERGEPMDWAAVLFGAAVFGLFLAVDLLLLRRAARGA
jgi:hypothetical protein